jgi:hypothetical protein
MVLWLVGIVVFVLLWAGLWRSQPKAAFGVLIGLPIAWILSLIIQPYVTGMNDIPIWLPPIPVACIAIVLFYFGVRTWLRADSLPPPPKAPDEHGHGHGHDSHGQH